MSIFELCAVKVTGLSCLVFNLSLFCAATLTDLVAMTIYPVSYPLLQVSVIVNLLQKNKKQYLK